LPLVAVQGEARLLRIVEKVAVVLVGYCLVLVYLLLLVLRTRLLLVLVAHLLQIVEQMGQILYSAHLEHLLWAVVVAVE
jgi:hypothetical protein